MMKKYLGLLLALVVFWGLPVFTSAAEEPQIANSNLISSSDYDEIILLEDRVQGVIESAIYENNFEYSGPVTIDFSNAFKIYVDTNIFKLQNNKDTVLNALENGTYIWIYPFSVGEHTINVNISKGLPLDPEVAPYLTEEQQQEVIDNTGKWFVSGYSIKNNNMDYIQQTKEIKLAENDTDDFVFVGGLPGFRQPVAVSFDETEMVSVIPLSSPVNIQTKSNSSKILDYEAAAQLSAQYEANSSNKAGGYMGESSSGHSLQFLYWLIPTIIVAGAVACFLLIRRKHV